MTASDRGETSRGRPYVIGVTGNIACGKSTVMRRLAALGARAIDADDVYHELVRPGSPLLRRLAGRFGPATVADDGSLDRRALGAIVFSDPAALADLDALTHPAVIEAVQERIDGASEPVVAVDAVKLIESGMGEQCDAVWVVVCSRENQIARLMARGRLSRKEAERRIDAQPPLAAKLAQADAVIANDGPIEQTWERVDELFRRAMRESDAPISLL